MNGEQVICALKRTFRTKSDYDIAKKLGVSLQSIRNWNERKSVTARQFAGLVRKAHESSAKHALSAVIRPLVEFYEIQKCISTGGGKFEIFRIEDASGKRHPYRYGLKKVLTGEHGVYVFHDSVGRAIYAGKAKQQNLWKEMHSAFNRKGNSGQTILRVNHPEIRVEYKTPGEKGRQIAKSSVRLHEIARYFSAFAVAPEMIDNLESLLVRSFANDLINIRMEKFPRQHKRTR